MTGFGERDCKSGRLWNVLSGVTYTYLQHAGRPAASISRGRCCFHREFKWHYLRREFSRIRKVACEMQVGVFAPRFPILTVVIPDAFTCFANRISGPKRARFVCRRVVDPLRYYFDEVVQTTMKRVAERLARLEADHLG